MNIKLKKLTAAIFALLLCCISLVGCDINSTVNDIGNSFLSTLEKEIGADSSQSVTSGTVSEIRNTVPSYLTLDDIPNFNGSPYVELNNNKPYFSESDMTTDSFESYAELDSLGRCGVCYACIGQDIMPTEERGKIGMVKPSGWHLSKYDFVNGKYLYNRCHLIGYQLAGENANEKNLITGTRYLNVDGMLPFENEVADYVHKTNNHVLYRVTPIFHGDNLVASGLTMEAYSVEDSGEGICFCVYCYNAQPGVIIDYATGENESDHTLE